MTSCSDYVRKRPRHIALIILIIGITNAVLSLYYSEKYKNYLQNCNGIYPNCQDNSNKLLHCYYSQSCNSTLLSFGLNSSVIELKTVVAPITYNNVIVHADAFNNISMYKKYLFNTEVICYSRFNDVLSLVVDNVCVHNNYKTIVVLLTINYFAGTVFCSAMIFGLCIYKKYDVPVRD